MQVDVRLHGTLKEKHDLDGCYHASCLRDLVSLLEANSPGFSGDLLRHRYTFAVGGKEVSATDADLPFTDASVDILPIAEGEGEYVLQALVTILVATAVEYVTMLLFPDQFKPEEAEKQPVGDTFNGAINTSPVSGVVPLCYGGPIKVGSKVISTAVTSKDVTLVAPTGPMAEAQAVQDAYALAAAAGALAGLVVDGKDTRTSTPLPTPGGPVLNEPGLAEVYYGSSTDPQPSPTVSVGAIWVRGRPMSQVVGIQTSAQNRKVPNADVFHVSSTGVVTPLFDEASGTFLLTEAQAISIASGGPDVTNSTSGQPFNTTTPKLYIYDESNHAVPTFSEPSNYTRLEKVVYPHKDKQRGLHNYAVYDVDLPHAPQVGAVLKQAQTVYEARTTSVTIVDTNARYNRYHGYPTKTLTGIVWEDATSSGDAQTVVASSSTMEVIDAISEGPIAGFPNSLEHDVFLNNVPIVDAATGLRNYKDVGLDARLGYASQTPFDNRVAPGSGNYIAVSTKVKNGSPISRSVTLTTVDIVDVTILFPRGLSVIADDGSIQSRTVDISVTINGQEIVGVGHQKQFVGKSTQEIRRTLRINLTAYGSPPYTITVSRLTPDSTSLKVSDEMYWDSYTEYETDRLEYPFTAMVQTRVPAKSVGGRLPSRAFRILGRKVKVPNGYTPPYQDAAGVWHAAVYPATWDGTFAPGEVWTSNPAWIFYDLLTHRRYGVGERMVTLPSLAELYQLSQYCDQFVPDGKGGVEPRFTCNLYLQNAREATRVLRDVASVFRGMAVWDNGRVTTVYDAPKQPVAIYTAANVIDGAFSYSGTDRSTRYTVAAVQWNDPEDDYRQTIEYVEDRAGVLRYGRVVTNLIAVGTLSKGQAHRVGSYVLATSQTESESVTFRTGLDSMNVLPGDIIKIADPDRQQKRNGGRVVSITPGVGVTDTAIELDAPVDVVFGATTITLLSGGVATAAYSVVDTTGQHTTVHISSADDVTGVLPGSVWVIETSADVLELWRVSSVSEVDNEGAQSVYEISATKYNPNKFSAIDTLSNFVPRLPSPSKISEVVVPPGEVSVAVDPSALAKPGFVSLSVTWVESADAAVESYTVEVRARSFAEVVYSKEVRGSATAAEIPAGDSYTVSVRARNTVGVLSTASSATITIDPAVGLPQIVVSGLELAGKGNDTTFEGHDATFHWRAHAPGITPDFADDAGLTAAPAPWFRDYIVKVKDATSGEVLRDEATTSTEYTYTLVKNKEDGGPRRSFTIEVSARSVTGEAAGPVAALTVSNPTPAVPTGVVFTPAYRSLKLDLTPPNDQDYAGVQVWLSSTAGVATTQANLVFQGADLPATIDVDGTGAALAPGQTYYLKLAAYDAFGTTGLTVSQEFTATTGSSLPVTDWGADVTGAGVPSPNATAGGNLVYNSDFESGLTGWQNVEQSTTAQAFSVVADPWSAGYGQVLKIDQPASSSEGLGVGSKTFRLVKGRTYRARFICALDAGLYNSTGMFLRVQFATTNVEPITSGNRSTYLDGTTDDGRWLHGVGNAFFTVTSGWEVFEYTFTAKENYANIAAYAWGPDNASSPLYVAEMSVFEALSEARPSHGNRMFMSSMLRGNTAGIYSNTWVVAGGVQAIAGAASANYVEPNGSLWGTAITDDDNVPKTYTLAQVGDRGTLGVANSSATLNATDGSNGDNINEIHDLWLVPEDPAYPGSANSAAVPVSPGDWLEVSAYANVHRCKVDVRFVWYDASRNLLAGIDSVDAVTGTFDAGTSIVPDPAGANRLSQYKRIWTIAQVPANAAYVLPLVRKHGTNAGTAPALEGFYSSYAFITRPFWSEATEGQTQPSPWSDGATFPGQITSGNSGTYIGPDAVGNSHLAANSVTANKVLQSEITETSTLQTYSAVTLSAGGSTGIGFAGTGVNASGGGVLVTLVIVVKSAASGATINVVFNQQRYTDPLDTNVTEILVLDTVNGVGPWVSTSVKQVVTLSARGYPNSVVPISEFGATITAVGGTVTIESMRLVVGALKT